jgi:OmcA/MtrC family decaheme c-type cytochrome
MSVQLVFLKRLGKAKYIAAIAVMLISGMALYGQNRAAGPIGPAIDVSQLTPEAWAALDPKGAITSVTISAAPVVKFYLTDSRGVGLKGLGNFKSKAATASLTSYPNLSFVLAKLVPEDVTATGKAPSKWVSYIVTSTPNVASPASVPTRPTSDNTGTLVDNGDGTYQYTFYRDVKKTKAVLDAYKYDAGKNEIKADLGDTTYAPTLTHRLTIQFSGNARGTGSNTADGVTVATAVAMKKPVNLVYDFIPVTGKPVTGTNTQREVVAVQNCNSCHTRFTTFHGGSRVETQYCVVCHTDQRKYGQAEAARTATGYSGMTYRIDGAAVGDFTSLIHGIHQGKELTKTGYNYANVLFNDIGYSMLGGGQKMCSVCHSNVAQAENWNTKPSILACGSCHDQADFAKGDNHPAGAAADNDCARCHTPAEIKTTHQTQNVTAHNPVVAPGLVNFTYEIKSAAASATDVKVVFKIAADGKPVTFVAPATPMANPLVGFTGSPSFLLAYAMPQDGVNGSTIKLIDYNNLGSGAANFQPISVSIANLLDTANAATMGSLSGPDANGSYTATIVNKKMFPTGAKLRSVSLQGYFSQITAPGTEKAPIGRHTVSVVKPVAGDDVRRKVVDSAKCASCHEWFEGHGGNRVYEVQVCVTCHVPGLTTSGRGISDAALETYRAASLFTPADTASLQLMGITVPNPVAPGSKFALAFPQTTNNFKDMIHGIHAGKDRADPIQIVRDRTPGAITIVSGAKIGFPGILSDCQSCHTYNGYSGAPSNAFATREIADNGAIVDPPSAKASLATANATDKMTTPFTASCVSCHDSTAAQVHMTQQGGQIKVNRSALSTSAESCVVCHGAGKEFDPVKSHKQ